MTATLNQAGTASILDRVIPAPRLRETDSVDLAMTPEQAWAAVRHENLAGSPLINMLFAIRTLPGQLARREKPGVSAQVRVDDLVSAPGKPGFQILGENPPHELAVGAIGKVWHLDIPFIHVAGPGAFAAFDAPGYIKVAWAIRLAPLGERDTRVTFEVRVSATDDAAWRSFRRYFRLIGPGSRFIRRSALAGLGRAHGRPERAENGRPMPGDELLPDAAGQLTHGVTVHAPPQDIWPWLVQMGCRRGGFYSIDLLDNGLARSAREIHPELQRIRPGDIIPATPTGRDGFEVLRVSPPTELILGGLYDQQTARQLPFSAPRPAQYWHVTWAFVLDPRRDGTTRLRVRARAAFPDKGRLHALWLRQVHDFMQSAQLRHIAARAEGRLRRDGWRDVTAGTVGAARMAAGLATPFRRAARQHWGVDPTVAARYYPGDDLVPEPTWSWTHGIEVNASAGDTWPWLAQIGADRGGFYSYQWLENLAGCDVRNAEIVHPEWAVREGGELRLHPKMPPLRVVSVTPGRSIVAFISPPAGQGRRFPGRRRGGGMPEIRASWLFFAEPLDAHRCRVISRYRCAAAGGLASRLFFGPAVVEPIGFAMDRRMLVGLKQRAEQATCAGLHFGDPVGSGGGAA